MHGEMPADPRVCPPIPEQLAHGREIIDRRTLSHDTREDAARVELAVRSELLRRGVATIDADAENARPMPISVVR